MLSISVRYLPNNLFASHIKYLRYLTDGYLDINAFYLYLDDNYVYFSLV